ncbi:MAG TPA: PAS domain S-box protein [Acidobacteriota bacterium]|nr:PAS domain S-box protein [Acidobacteriota bacterium]
MWNPTATDNPENHKNKDETLMDTAQVQREREHRLRLIMNAAPVLISYVNSEFRYELVNQSYERWFGRTPEEINGRHVREILGEEAWKEVRPYMERALRGEEVAFDKQLTYPHVGSHWVHVSYTPDRDSTGCVRGFVAVINDIGKIRQADSAVRESEERYRNLFESSREGIILLDMSGRITAANPALLHMLGYTLGELKATTYIALTPARWHVAQERIVREQVLKRGYSDEYEKEYIRKDGSIVPISKRVWLLTDEAGNPIGMWGLVRDITAQKRAEEALRESEQRERARAEELRLLNQELERRVAQRTAEATQRAAQLQALAAELTNAEERERRRLAQILHDHLQQLLVGARMRAAIVSRRVADPAIRREILRFDELLHQAIQESRSLTAQLSPPILYDAGLGPALEWLGRWIQEKNDLEVAVSIGQDSEPPQPEIRTLLFQVARELLLNVVKHSEADRSELRLQRAGKGFIELIVADDGKGFDPEEVSPGSGGFGLFSIRQRLDLMGGSVKIESRPGSGTRVSLKVPCVTAQVARAPQASPRLPRDQSPDAARSEPRIRVLLADDQEILREGLGGLLRDHPEFEVVGEAADGEQALQLARTLRPDVVVMDASMPRMNGIESTRVINRELPDVRVIGLSMYSEEEMGGAMLEAGAVAYLSKACPVDQLVAEIRRAAALQRVTGC